MLTVSILSSATTLDHGLLWVILYVGPDVMLPLASALAAIAGVLLMFWNRCVGLLRSVWNMLFHKNNTPRA